MFLLTGMMLLTACNGSRIGTSVDSALCEELKGPVDRAVATTLEYRATTPAPVINDWTSVVKGFDAGCKTK